MYPQGLTGDQLAYFNHDAVRALNFIGCNDEDNQVLVDALPDEVTAENLDAVILLKGHETVITDGDVCYVNTTGNPGMATGGSGDVLSGIIVGLLGQGLEPLTATAVGAWLHGRAGDICASKLGQYGMLPSDMLKELPLLLKRE